MLSFREVIALRGVSLVAMPPLPSSDGSPTDTRLAKPVTLCMASSIVSVTAAVLWPGRTVLWGILRWAVIIGRWNSGEGIELQWESNHSGTKA